jgi:outer membrane receptor protein involved in Fe transport
LTAARGYLVAPPLIRFLQTPVGPPLDLTALEGGLRASPIGPALAGVPEGQLFTNSAAVPLLALGDEDIRPERVTSYEAGYKAQVGALFVSLDTYVSKIDGFISQLLPGVNPDYPVWTAPDAVPEAARAPLEQAVLGAVGNGLARLSNGSTAYVLSGGNAGRATEHGAELAMQWRRNTNWQFDANYTYYGFTLEKNSFFAGDSVLSNTPKSSGNVAVTWMRPQGTRVRIGARLSEQFQWRSSIWIGTVPPMASVDVVLSHPLSRALTASVVGTNILDQQRFQFYGGSLVGRRVMASMTWRP